MWAVDSTEEYDAWFEQQDDESKVALLAAVYLLETFGPQLGRPHADTLKGSKLKYLKELRKRTANHVFRVAYIFDERRKGLLLIAGDKKGVNEKGFYKRLVGDAEALVNKYRG